jgi:NAD(P)-dependent dehydrogenase (short-subunit alcohol dehydrogenase family)
MSFSSGDKSPLEGRVALVTGAGRGIGRAIAGAFADAGADVVVSSRTEAELIAAEAAIEKAGRNALAVVADLTDRRQVFEMADKAQQKFGAIDIVVSNAAALNRHGAMVDMDLELLRTMLAVNLEGTVSLLQAVGPHMLDRGSGSVIIVSSGLSLRGSPYFAAYGASKAALNHLALSLAGEWGPHGVRVNALVPGPVITERMRPVAEDPVKYAQIRELFPLGRWPGLDEITTPALFLASDASSFVNGQLLVVDGGLSSVAVEST